MFLAIALLILAKEHVYLPIALEEFLVNFEAIGTKVVALNYRAYCFGNNNPKSA